MKRYVRSGAAAGLLIGAAVGAAVCWFEYPFPNYTLVGNELIVEALRRFVSPSLARAIDSPFRLLGLYALGGSALGVAAGLFAFLLPGGRGETRSGRKGRVAMVTTLILATVLFGYFLLALLHFRLPGRGTAAGGGILLLLSLAAGCAAGRFASLLVPASEPARPGRLVALAIAAILIAETASLWSARASHGGDASGGGDPSGGKVAIICLDGLGWGVIRPLLEAGELPALSGLIEDGSSGILRSTLPPIKSPQVWTSVATSRLPRDHGVHDFLSYSKERGKWVTTTNRIRRKPTFWDILGQFEIPVDVFSWYPSWPPDSIPGVMLTDRATYFAVPDRVWPASYEPFLDSLLAEYVPAVVEFRKRFTRYDPSADDDPDGADLRTGAVKILDQTSIRDQVTLSFVLRKLGEGQSDVTAVYFRGSDSMQHKFRKYYASIHDPMIARFLYDLKDWEREELGGVIDGYIRFIDECIGKIVARLEPGTTVIVLSDHDSGYRYDHQIAVRPGPLCEKLGWQAQGEEGADMNRTRIYGVKDSKRADMIRFHVNLRGREEMGIVPRRGFDALLEEALSTLRNLVTGKGAPLFVDVCRSGRAGKEKADGDLVARINPEALGGTVVIGGDRLPVSDIATRSPKSGNHRISGMIVLSGGVARKGARIRGATIYDVTPTLFYLLGLPLAVDWEGDPIVQGIEKEFVDEHPVKWGSSYDGLMPLSGVAAGAEGAEEAVREELRSLGYIQ